MPVYVPLAYKSSLRFDQIVSNERTNIYNGKVGGRINGARSVSRLD